MKQGETFSYTGAAIRTTPDGDTEVEVDGTFVVTELADGSTIAVAGDARLADPTLGLDRAVNTYRIAVADVAAFRKRQADG